jgi:O-antigen biosynthesis protein WbqP
MIRFFDIFLSLLGVVVFAPIILTIFIVIYLTSGSPVFVQKRVGRREVPFKLLKFRTMRVGAANVPTHMASLGDVTAIGRVLRKTKLDELPQLFNVLSGSMSLVGPRPCLPTQIELIEARRSRGVFSVRPGVTGLAQLSGVDMSSPILLAEVDSKMIASITVFRYFNYILRTATGSGYGDRVRH